MEGHANVPEAEEGKVKKERLFEDRETKHYQDK